MKYKNKYTFYHNVDTDKEKQTVKVNKKNINDIKYESYTKINGTKYSDIILKEDGNGITVISNRHGKLRLDYDEVVALHAALDTAMLEMGFEETTVILSVEAP